MSIKKNIKKRCPHCGAVFESAGYEVINATLESDLKDKVLNGIIFDFTCPECKQLFRSPYSMAYQDMEREYMLYLDMEHWGKEESIADTLKLFPFYRIRVVDDMMDLIEKIHIFSAGLNDKIITYLGYKIKDDITVKMKTAKQPIQVHKALFDSLKGKEGEINFGLLSTSPKPIFVTTPTRDYEYLLKKSPIHHEFEERDGVYQIDEHWAAGIDKALIA